MRIQVIGAGVVGQATGKGFARLGHEVHFYDVQSEVALGLRREGYNADWKLEVVKADIYFICTPEDAMKKVLRDWISTIVPSPAVIRSTVLPRTARNLSEENHGIHICSNPEFLREAVAEYEFLNPPGIIIGECCKPHGDLLESLYEPLRKPIYRTTCEVAELTKLAVNGYLACQISYWSQIKLIADKLKVNSHKVGMLASYGDDRVSVYGSRMHGKPYAGKCLPKDLAQLQALADRLGVKGDLLKAIKEINDCIRG